MKPVETGCPRRPGKRRPIDGRVPPAGRRERSVRGGSLSRDARAAGGPSVAARIERRSINLPDLKRSIEKLGRRHDLVVVEGAGGLLVPMTGRSLQIDFVISLDVRSSSSGGRRWGRSTKCSFPRRGADSKDPRSWGGSSIIPADGSVWRRGRPPPRSHASRTSFSGHPSSHPRLERREGGSSVPWPTMRRGASSGGHY